MNWLRSAIESADRIFSRYLAGGIVPRNMPMPQHQCNCGLTPEMAEKLKALVAGAPQSGATYHYHAAPSTEANANSAAFVQEMRRLVRAGALKP